MIKHMYTKNKKRRRKMHVSIQKLRFDIADIKWTLFTKKG